MDSEKITGIVSSVKHTAGAEAVYTIIGDRVALAKSNLDLSLRDRVELQRGEGGYEKISVTGTASMEEYEDALSRLVESLGIRERAAAMHVGDSRYIGILLKMADEMANAAVKLARAFISGAPIVVRFHNDGDGSSGAIALHKALRNVQALLFREERGVAWHMNRSISYSEDSLYEDKMVIGQYASIEKPIVFIIDFGTTDENADSVKMLADEASIIQIDHHPRCSGFDDAHISHYMNPWDFGGGSDETAGMVTGFFAEILSEVDVDLMMNASLISDCSVYAGAQESKAGKVALVLDFLTSSRRSGPRVTPKTMETIIDDETRMSEAYAYARSSLDEAMGTAMSNLRRFTGRNDLNVFALDFGCISDLGLRYPLPGRFSSKLQDVLEEKNHGNTVTLVYYGSYISVRLSSDVSDSVDILGIINRMRNSPNMEISGGGHREAAGIKSGNNSIRMVVNALLAELGVQSRGIQE